MIKQAYKAEDLLSLCRAVATRLKGIKIRGYTPKKKKGTVTGGGILCGLADPRSRIVLENIFW